MFNSWASQKIEWVQELSGRVAKFPEVEIEQPVDEILPQWNYTAKPKLQVI